MSSRLAPVIAAITFVTGLGIGAPAYAGKKAKADAAPKVTISPAARDEATKVWGTLCSACHGIKGVGDGPGAAALPTKPRNFGDPAWQKEAKDPLIEKVIVEGGPAIGKSPLMTPNPSLKDKPEVVAALREMIRGFGKK